MLLIKHTFLIFALITSLSSAEISASCSFDPAVSDTAGAKIAEIVTTVAKTRALYLAVKKNHLEKLGDDVHKEVAFFPFWAYIFSRPELASAMRKIQNSSMKYNPFIGGGREALLGATKTEGDLECFLKTGEEFATYLKVNPSQVKALLQEGLKKLNEDQTGLKPFFDFLITEKSK